MLHPAPSIHRPQGCCPGARDAGDNRSCTTNSRFETRLRLPSSSMLLRPPGLAIGPDSGLAGHRVCGGASGGHHVVGSPTAASSLGCLLHTKQSVLDSGDILAP
ncbi:hypothetical protein ZWY2020_059042 [Hordeum vulgare]|nr:hypothetical protein ZWY2020_059042 [Hordeum vulgare]